MRRGISSTGRARTVGLALMLVTGSVPAGAAHASGQAATAAKVKFGVEVRVATPNGRVRIAVTSTNRLHAPKPPKAGVCVSFVPRARSGENGKVTVCPDGRNWARVTTAEGRQQQIPAVFARKSARQWRVDLRQADLSLAPGDTTVSVRCAVRCQAATPRLAVKQLVLESCRAKGPWLVHGATRNLGKAVALTFDDGPGAGTRRILRILKQQHVAATFFQVGEWIQRDPKVLRLIRRQGHVLANHSYNHQQMTGSDSWQLTRTNAALRRASGFEACLFRAPYGENPPAVVEEARQEGMVTVHWNVDPEDWKSPPASRVVSTTLSEVQPGSIMVLHDFNPSYPTAAALPRLIRELRERGYRFLTVPELLSLPVKYR